MVMVMKVGVAKLYSCTVVQSCQSDHFLLIKMKKHHPHFLELPGGMDARWTLKEKKKEKLVPCQKNELKLRGRRQSED